MFYGRKIVVFPLVFKLFVFITAFSNLSNLILFYFTEFDQVNLFSLYMLFQNCFLILAFHKFYHFNRFYLNPFYILIILNIVFYLITLKYSPIDRYSYFGTYSKSIMSILSISIIIERYFKSKSISLFEDFIFNLSIAVVLYNGLQLYVAFFNSIILKHVDELFLYTWPIVQISSITYYLLITRAIWKLKN
jgi:hypothetical protein